MRRGKIENGQNTHLVTWDPPSLERMQVMSTLRQPPEIVALEDDGPRVAQLITTEHQANFLESTFPEVLSVINLNPTSPCGPEDDGRPRDPKRFGTPERPGGRFAMPYNWREETQGSNEGRRSEILKIHNGVVTVI